MRRTSCQWASSSGVRADATAENVSLDVLRATLVLAPAGLMVVQAANMISAMQNPSLGMAANVYRRRYGEWPQWVRFCPRHFGDWATELDANTLMQLCTALRVLVSVEERSSRLTVGGSHGSVTYDDGVTEDDYDSSSFEAWVRATPVEPE